MSLPGVGLQHVEYNIRIKKTLWIIFYSVNGHQQ